MKKIAVFILILFLGVVYLVAQTGAADVKASVQRGKKVYTQYCLACHQADGGGVPRMNPPLQKTEYVLGDKKRLITIILKGLNDPIEINGDEYVNPMASHAHLSDQQIADVLTFVRNSFGNKASGITPVEVKQIRAKK
ncbi:MAG: cytochrome c [Chitinophagaceae bacterium]|jgi:mono/diheme cytochrome c family protein|nr:cytochrome c [Chitinophagaceae bacterium]